MVVYSSVCFLILSPLPLLCKMTPLLSLKLSLGSGTKVLFPFLHDWEGYGWYSYFCEPPGSLPTLYDSEKLKLVSAHGSSNKLPTTNTLK